MAVAESSISSPFIVLICICIANLASPFTSDWIQIPSRAQVEAQQNENGPLRNFSVTIKTVRVSDSYLWGIDDRANDTFPPGNLVMCERPCTDGDWIDGYGALDHIDASSREVWGINLKGRLFRKPIYVSNTAKFSRVESFESYGCGCSTCDDMSVSNNVTGNGYLWVLSCGNTTMCSICDGSDWMTIPHDMSLMQIEAGDEEVWAVDDNNHIFKRPVDGGGNWSIVQGEMRYVSASGNAHIWGIAPNDSLYVCEKPCTGVWQYVGGSFKQVSGGNNAVIGVTTNNSILFMSLEDFNITAEIPTTSESPTTTQPPTTTSIGSPAAASTLIPIIATLACVIILLLLVVIVCGTLVMITKKVIRKHRIKDTNGQVKYISSEGGYLATEDGSRGICGFDNRVYSNNGTSDPEYDSIDDTGISAESDKNVKSTVGHDTQSEPQESESLSNDFRNRMDSVPNVYSLERRTNSNAQVALSKGETGISPHGKDLTDNYEMDGSVDKNYCKPGETIGDEYDYANEEEFWEPASQEKELMMQVEKLIEIPVINNKALQIHDELGSGQFGTVYRGMWQQTADSEDTGVEVAVKTMGEGASEEERVKFLQEAAIMGQFKNHPNVLSILGIVLDTPYKIVVELMHNGDLHHYLATLRPDPDQPVSNELSQMLLSYSRQVAFGLMYLSFKKYVHRDIAARNILVNDEGICKIADFGLSRDLFDENYYVSHGGKVPVKWTAPEAINYRKYSMASDVWSYGCLLYEIWSLGVKPFHDVSNKQAVEKIDSGYRLPPPPGCPKAVYQIMIKCWHPTAASRPSPSSIVMGLSHPDFQVLKWSQKDIDATSEKARTLGAPLTEGHALYKGLQQKYMPTS